MNELISCQPIATMPWLCLGDFNLICEASDKNKANINRRQMREFRRALDASELIELRLVSRKFTWSNGRKNPTLVHLDRALCNRAWDGTFPPLSLLALSSSISDHWPLLLCNHQLSPRRAVFRFKHFWTRSSNFSEIVESAWLLPARGSSSIIILHNRLTNTAQCCDNGVNLSSVMQRYNSIWLTTSYIGWRWRKNPELYHLLKHNFSEI